jgi:DNA-binding CsgD family transcriptional regulator
MSSKSRLIERDGDLATIATVLDGVRRGERGDALLIEGPPGVGKTALLGRLRELGGEAGFQVLRARGAEMERDFGFGLVRQLFGPLMHSLDPDRRGEALDGPARLAASIFGLDGEEFEVGGSESSLYGLFWLLAGLAERRPLILAVDDAHWADSASLRFFDYLGRRLDGLPVLLVLAARPNEPGVQAELLQGIVAELAIQTLRPAPLSEAGSAAIVRERLGGDATDAVEEACHQATGGNPFLLEELLVELRSEGGPPPSPGRIAAMGPDRIAAGVEERARRLDPLAPEVTRAAAVLGAAADLRALAAMVGCDRGRAATIADGLAAAAILAAGAERRFIHPLVRSAVYERIPSGRRTGLHARAAEILRDQGLGAEAVAAHLLLCEPGAVDGAAATLERAAADAALRGAPDSAIAYLRRALGEPDIDRVKVLRELGSLEVVVRDPASIGHLQEAAGLIEDPREALEIYLELADVLSLAGQWDTTVQIVDSGLERFEELELPGLLDLEAFRAAYCGYDPARVADFDRSLPRLRKLVEDHPGEESLRLRWILATLGSIRDMPRAEVEALIEPAGRRWTMRLDGRESSSATQAGCALLVADSFEEAAVLARDLTEDGRRRGALLSIISGVGFSAARHSRMGDLRSAEADLGVTLELVEENDLSLMALTTMLHFCIDTVIERRALAGTAAMVEQLELPPPFVATQSGGMVLESRAALRAIGGDRVGAVEDLRAAAAIFGPLQAGPRFTRWRSRLALLLAEERRQEALELAAEELALARAVANPRAEGAALRALGMLQGGSEGIVTLRESVAVLRDGPLRLELARSLAELGGAMRRGNSRRDARRHLREAADLAQRCGAERLEERIYEELRIAGGRPRRRAQSGAASLTPGERRVAAAAASGSTNREIAQELFVSLRTVEMHLTNSYRKLGITSRAQLAAAIEDPAGAPTGIAPP